MPDYRNFVDPDTFDTEIDDGNRMTRAYKLTHHADTAYYTELRHILFSNRLFQRLHPTVESRANLKRDFGLQKDKETIFRRASSIHQWCPLAGKQMNDVERVNSYMQTLPKFASYCHNSNQVDSNINQWGLQSPYLHTDQRLATTDQHLATIKHIAKGIREKSILPYESWNLRKSQLNREIHKKSGSQHLGPTAHFALYMWVCTEGMKALYNEDHYTSENWEDEYYTPFVRLID